MRIASLLPSATEIVFALGAQDELVGVTFECDFPAEARQGRAILVGGLDTAGLDAAAIDELVRTKVAAGQELYTLDDAAVRRLQPDVVLTQDLCRVCALPAGAVDAALDRLGCDAAVITLDPHTLDDVLATVEAVGDAIGRRAEAAALLAGLRARLDAVAAAVADRRRPSVFVLEWPDPPFVAGHWVPELVERAGGRRCWPAPGSARWRRPGSRSRLRRPRWSWWRRAATTSTPPPRMPSRWHTGSPPGWRCGRWTPTPSWCAPAPGWSTGWRRWPRCCTAAGPPRRWCAGSAEQRRSGVAPPAACQACQAWPLRSNLPEYCSVCSSSAMVCTPLTTTAW
ncbi:MAG: ABC transporter substrate-binding protein [Acidimicrobiales bacterium]